MTRHARLTVPMVARRLRRRRRGSALLLVVAVLSLLLLAALTMSYTSRLEASSAAAFSQKISDRISRDTVVRRRVATLAEALPAGATGRLDLALDREFLASRPGPKQDRGSASTRRDDGARALAPVRQEGDVVVGIEDVSGRVNINAASEEVLASFFSNLSRERGLSLNGEAIAAAIVSTRLGPDGGPGRADRDDDGDSPEAARLAGTTQLRAASLRATGGSLTPGEANRLASEARDPAAQASGLLAAERTRQRETFLSAIDEADEHIADIRMPVFGDDVRFHTLADLLRHKSITRAGLTPAALAAAQPYLTVFSTSVDQRAVDGDGRLSLDANRATLEEIEEALGQAFPDRPQALRRQFAVNLLDARDADSVPTVHPESDAATPIIGLERTPFISEVYPRSTTPEEEGDEGEFIEIHNPWTETLDVSGWSLRGAIRPVLLTGRISPGGHLVVTDDPDNRMDPPDRHLRGTGSLYDIFGVLPNASDRRVVAERALEIPHRGSLVTITLHNAGGDLVDVFTFRATDPTSPGEAGATLASWQRENPAVRAATRQRATPFAQLAPDTTPDAGALARLRLSPADGPFMCPSDVLDVFAGFADGASGVSNLWAFPRIDPRQDEDSADLLELDARLLDLFRVAERDEGGLAARYDESDAGNSTAGANELHRRMVEARDAGRLQGADATALLHQAAFARRPGVHHGRINLNSAPAIVLASLPGVTPQAAEAIVRERDGLERRARAGEAVDGLLYRSWADVIADDRLLGNPSGEAQRLARFRQLAPHAALNSRAFLLVGQTTERTASGALARRGRLTEALVALEDRTPTYVYWDGWD